MLIHSVGILCFVVFSGADVPSRLFAVSHLKGIIQGIQQDLVQFKLDEQAELSKLETMKDNSFKNETACLMKISQAHKETRKMLNMMVEGERNQLETALTSLNEMRLNELTKLWGSLSPGGKSRVVMDNEINNYRKTAKARIVEAEKSCETP